MFNIDKAIYAIDPQAWDKLAAESTALYTRCSVEASKRTHECSTPVEGSNQGPSTGSGS
jgi:hypothetical protein